ncbi:5'-AMP-activated serine/threonine-protein kinase catalytic subunit alpha-like [Hibiscus syriacus]|uniref:5'-AMP-activated serine/threonine-protein kinase catalytic subunit alpha-like n=1 Tax=Hibiscus syriacus TaxID=106335 RepID=UPI0019206818|nr:5'-AMP-activated serine/threonine-protein kinase catalytic subunit alpha-like [Hibiscus syriacus]
MRRTKVRGGRNRPKSEASGWVFDETSTHSQNENDQQLEKSKSGGDDGRLDLYAIAALTEHMNGANRGSIENSDAQRGSDIDSSIFNSSQNGVQIDESNNNSGVEGTREKLISLITIGSSNTDQSEEVHSSDSSIAKGRTASLNTNDNADSGQNESGDDTSNDANVNGRDNSSDNQSNTNDNNNSSLNENVAQNNINENAGQNEKNPKIM